MSHELVSQSIFLEGPSCSGKTCLLRAVENKDVDVILKNWPADLKSPPLEFFLERDEDKLIRARASIKQLKLIDRGYLSTMTFYSVLEEQEGISAEPVYEWFTREIGNKLYRPDHYIFVDIAPKVVIDRAKRAGRVFASNNMWFKFPERINFWYKKLLALYEPATSVIAIDGNRSQNIVTEEFNDLISDLRKEKTK